MTRSSAAVMYWGMLVVCAILAVPQSGAAHGGKPSSGYLVLQQQPRLNLRLPIPAFAKVSESLGARANPSRILGAMFQLYNQEGQCPAKVHIQKPGNDSIEAAGQSVEVSIEYLCPNPTEFVSQWAQAVAPSHRLILRVRNIADTDQLQHFVLDQRRQKIDVGTGRSGLMRWVEDIGHGMLHMLGGLDHILFVCALVMAVGVRMRNLFWAVSGFTLGHTITLFVAASGGAEFDSRLVEFVIALSIAATAAMGAGLYAWVMPAVFGLLGGLTLWLTYATDQNWVFATGIMGMLAGLYGHRRAEGFSRSGQRESLWELLALPTIFGAFHGVGFAGPLMQDASGEDSWSHLATILRFNLGVELGQWLVLVPLVAAVVLAGRIVTPARQSLQNARVLVVLALLSVSVYWMIERML